MESQSPSPFSVILRATVVHTVTYFLIGLVAFTLFDYTGRFADPVVAGMMRQTDHPLVSAGPMFQVIRGILFGVVFFALREVVLVRPRGWLTMWLVLVVVGILSPFGSAPSSIEGAVYTVLPLSFHLIGLPEILVQSALLAFLTHYWVGHPHARWLNWVLGIAFALVVLMAALGVMAAVGMLPTPA